MSTAVLLSTAAVAGPNSSGAYVGLGFGNTVIEDDDFVRQEVTTASFDDTDVGATLYGGYQFNNIVGVELSFSDYGKFKAQDGFAEEPTSFSVSANVGYSFLDGQLRPFGVMGFGIVNMNYKNLPSYVLSSDDTGGSVHYGVGIQYEPDVLAGLGFRLAYEADSFAIEVSDIFGNDTTYTQTLGMLYAGVQFKF